MVNTLETNTEPTDESSYTHELLIPLDRAVEELFDAPGATSDAVESDTLEECRESPLPRNYYG